MSVKHAILALLFDHEMHGYEMNRRIALALKTGWDVKPGQIAGTLARLEEAGLVSHERQEGEAAPDRKVYRLTHAGEQELIQWYLTPEVREYEFHEPFYLKLVFSLLNAPVPPEQVIVAQRRQLFQRLHEVTELREEVDAEVDLPRYLLLQTVVMHIEADIRWLDMCEMRLSDLKRYQPTLPPPLPRGRPRRQQPDQD